MKSTNTSTTLTQKFLPVKSPINSQFPLLPDLVIHHKGNSTKSYVILKDTLKKLPSPYGVSLSLRVLTPSLFIKKYDRIRDCLRSPLGMTSGQCEVTLRLLRLWAYYGSVYPKESQITGGIEDQPIPQSWEQWYKMSTLPRARGCSKATFWRTIRLLQELGLIQVINRYVMRPHAQISNLYLLKELLIVIARYLAELGHTFRVRWIEPYLDMPADRFWRAPFLVAESRGEPWPGP